MLQAAQSRGLLVIERLGYNVACRGQVVRSVQCCRAMWGSSEFGTARRSRSPAPISGGSAVEVLGSHALGLGLDGGGEGR